MVAPSRRIVIESATRETSPSLCEIRDRRDALRLELQQQLEQCVAVALVEAGGRLIQNEQTYFLGERLGNLDQLLLADTYIGDQRICRFVQPYLCQQVLSARVASFQSITPRWVHSLPRKMFSLIESIGTSASSWWMMTMPSFSLWEISLSDVLPPRR